MGLLDGMLGDAVGSLLGGGNPAPAQGASVLDSILSGLGGGTGRSTGLLAAVMGLLQQNGGLGKVLGMLEQSGLGQHASSWVGTGANMAISGDHVQQVFGASSISGIASQLGLTPGQAGAAIAQLLPEIVNQMTPQGQVPTNHEDLLSQGLALLRGGA
jgi:uncharacterized protein YidB (DUF937 family)